ncbi:unnamed protein product [Orchesella dallaii]|uniref:C2H2-type domain-containing protein n=1 Tax=Orchesella dallaii TaxID=48710 RepID=A0ABP1PW75_9HEXA
MSYPGDLGQTYRIKGESYQPAELKKNTVFLGYFKASSVYECGARALGCPAVVSGLEIEKHELKECKFRTLRYCQFATLKCSKTFTDFNRNVLHLMEDHKIPVVYNPRGHFLIRYDRKEYLDTNVDAHHGIVPLIRAAMIVMENGEVTVCLLLAKDMGEHTRVWVAHCGTSERPPLVANVFICPPHLADVGKPMLERKVSVMRAVDIIPILESTDCYVEVENEYLDQSMRLEVKFQKYFTICVGIKKVTTQPEVLGSCESTGNEVEHDVDVDSGENDGEMDDYEEGENEGAALMETKNGVALDDEEEEDEGVGQDEQKQEQEDRVILEDPLKGDFQNEPEPDEDVAPAKVEDDGKDAAAEEKDVVKDTRGQKQQVVEDEKTDKEIAVEREKAAVEVAVDEEKLAEEEKPAEVAAVDKEEVIDEEIASEEEKPAEVAAVEFEESDEEEAGEQEKIVEEKMEEEEFDEGTGPEEKEIEQEEGTGAEQAEEKGIVVVDDEKEFFPYAFTPPTDRLMTPDEQQAFELLGEMKSKIIAKKKAIKERKFCPIPYKDKIRLQMLECLFKVKFFE